VPDARQIVLIGGRTGASFSPAVWNRVFADFAIPLEYRSHDNDIQPTDLAHAVTQVRDAAVAAANVTMPYKGRAAELADVRDEDVERAGVTNFLVNRSGRLHAENTDLQAVRVALRQITVTSALLLGAGGAGTAALGGAIGAVRHVVIADRDEAAARKLAARARGWGMHASVVAWDAVDRSAEGADLIVNATPIGMDADDQRSPVPAELLRHRPAVYDFVYRKDMTPLQVMALSAGCLLYDGLAHLTQQAVAMIPGLGLPEATADALGQATADVAGRAPLTWATSAPRTPRTPSIRSPTRQGPDESGSGSHACDPDPHSSRCSPG
jgi:shikimate dehydrogenase